MVPIDRDSARRPLVAGAQPRGGRGSFARLPDASAGPGGTSFWDRRS